MKCVIIIQARYGSSRLPGKVLADVCGRPMLVRQLARLLLCREANELLVATTQEVEDDPVAAAAQSIGVNVHRGSTNDVLGRFVTAALASEADIVVRVTADCPLIDPETTDRVIRALVAYRHQGDYASNVIRRTYPRGLDTEAMFLDTLLRMDRFSRTPREREHVTLAARGPDPSVFLRHDVVDDDDNSDLRWTVDTAEDLALVRTIYDGLELDRRAVSYREVLAWVRERPELSLTNASSTTWSPV